MADWFVEDNNKAESARRARRESCTKDEEAPKVSTRASRLWNVASVLVVRGGGCWLISHATGLGFEAVVALYLGVVLLVIKVKR